LIDYEPTITVLETSEEIFCTGIISRVEELNTTSPFHLFPNPSQGQLFIKNPVPVNTSYQLFNVDGKLVQQGELTPEINLFNLSSGVYFLKIKDEWGVNVQVEKIVLENNPRP